MSTSANETKSCEHTLQQVGQSLGPQRDRPFGFVVGDGELLHAQLLRHFGLRSVVYQRTAEQLWTDEKSITFSRPGVNAQPHETAHADMEMHRRAWKHQNKPCME